MNDFERAELEAFENLGSGCCCPDLYDDSGKNCKACDWFEDCGEGHDLVSDSATIVTT